MVFDSRLSTYEHIQEVQKNLLKILEALQRRLINHDSSKLLSPEVELYNKYVPQLKEAQYGSEEYSRIVREMQPGLEHHYHNNRHHPQYHEGGISGMNLVDIVEMFCDWRAAARRELGDIHKSIDVSAERFGYKGNELEEIFHNTARDIFGE